MAELRPVLAMKIDNLVDARPQTGLTSADIVYVLPVEGGLSRFLAIFSSQYPRVAGPVRSGRLEDLPLLRQFGRPAFAYSGASPTALPVIERARTVDLNDGHAGGHFRDSRRPGIGGVLRDGTADYVRISQQPTALQAVGDARLRELAETLSVRGLAVQWVADMDGWLVYHAAFVSCVAAALYACGTDAGRLAADRRTLGLMCAAVTEAFAVLRRSGLTGRPRNLAVLHSPLLRLVAVRYWARVMRTPMGELCFAAHSRHAETEMRALGRQVSARLAGVPRTSHLHELLDQASRPARPGP